MGQYREASQGKGHGMTLQHVCKRRAWTLAGGTWGTSTCGTAMEFKSAGALAVQGQYVRLQHHTCATCPACTRCTPPAPPHRAARFWQWVMVHCVRLTGKGTAIHMSPTMVYGDGYVNGWPPPMNMSSAASPQRTPDAQVRALKRGALQANHCSLGQCSPCMPSSRHQTDHQACHVVTWTSAVTV